MLTTSRRTALLLIFISVSFFYGWNIIFRNHEWMLTLGANLFPIIGGTLSYLWIYTAYRNIAGKQRYFWLLLSIGILVYLPGNFIWIFSAIITGETLIPESSFLLWLISYNFFLLALIYKTKTISNSDSNKPYIFNILIFMITVTVTSIHYLINPIWNYSFNDSLLITIITLGFQVTNLSILFVITYLYYLTKNSKEKNVTLLIVIGFSLQVVADATYAYLTVNNSYQLGGVIEPIWLVALMIIGFSSYYAQGDANDPKLKIGDYIESKETVIPYVSSIILLSLALESYHLKLNALSIGIIIIFFMIIFRQLLILKKNKTLIREYKYLAYHDTLTGLNNRTRFNEDLVLLIEKAKQTKSSVALLMVDLDRFKNVNDTLGHYVGDQVLIQASSRLKHSFKCEHYLYRLGGDEFIVIIPQTTEQQCIVVAETLLTNFENSFIIGNHEITMTPSIGITLYPENGVNSETLLKTADAALYLAKASGRNNFHFYDSRLFERIARKNRIEIELKKVIKNKQLKLFYQPIVELKTGKFTGMEALLRWDHPELGSISPMEFIPIAEETGQIVSIGEWVLRTACIQNKTWQEAGFPSLCIAVNVSVCQFQRSDFVRTVKTILQETGLKPCCLQLEITESTMQNVKESTKVFTELKEIGIYTAIDDFGTGYSSLYILKEVPINILKIDKVFVDDVTEAKDFSMVKAIIDMGLNLNLKVIAEGIENTYQAEILTQYRCEFGQGYKFSKPVSAKDFEKLLTKRVLHVKD